MGLLELFTKIGIVIAKGTPVIMMLVGFTTLSLTIYSTVSTTSSTFSYVSDWIQNFSNQIGQAVSEVDVGGGPSGEASNLLPTLLRTMALDHLLKNVATLFVGVLSFITAYIGILATIVGAGISLWAYKKAKLFANLVSGSGAND